MRTPRPERYCSRCENKIHRDNKSGICKTCIDLSPERQAACAEAMRKEWANKEKRAKREAKLVEARAKLRAKRLSHIPEELHDLYLDLTRRQHFKAAEATRIVMDHYEKRNAA